MAAPSHVSTIARVARLLGEDEELLQDIAMGMEPEDGGLTVLNADDEATVASRPKVSRTSKSSSPTSSGESTPNRHPAR
jgi:hypothetical protein